MNDWQDQGVTGCRIASFIEPIISHGRWPSVRAVELSFCVAEGNWSTSGNHSLMDYMVCVTYASA